MGVRLTGLQAQRLSPRRHRRRAATWLGLSLVLASFGLWAGDLEDARQLFFKGKYAECIRQAEKGVRDQDSNEEWQLLLTDALMAVGHYTNAQTAVIEALQRNYGSVRLRWQAHEVFRQTGQAELAHRLLEDINSLAAIRGRWAYQDAPSLVALGRAALLLGAEPRRVLEQYFDRAKRTDPDCREAYLAAGQLALEKEDFALAAKSFGEGLKRFPNDPDLRHGLARAHQPSDRAAMLAALQAALAENPSHVPSFLLLADHLIDCEDYAAAARTLDQALAVNPWRPEAWAYRAVLAHLRNDTNAEAQARAAALKFWRANPLVDHLIGRKLSQKYRFAEGAARQRQALALDGDFLPARMQLALDLLRLGEETEGWRLAHAVHEADGYNVTAFNLVTLHDTLAKYRTLTNRDFVLRLSAREAGIYGQRALAVLQRARASLCPKYGFEPSRPTTVEIFADQKDFGVRTFGMPDNPGYAGVCFGPVITANSPATQTAHPVNWEAVLWHEFAHVVTLGLTRNKMPRWLSEGISVFEERQANPAWGQPMTARHREMLLGDDLKKVSELSAAFLAPKSAAHLELAYFQSGLVVEYLVERFGLEALKLILRDLGDGLEIHAAIAKRTAPLEQIEMEFAAFARARASALGPGLDWKKPEPAELARADERWFERHPKNFYALTERARRLLQQKKWREAQAPLTTLLEQWPSCPEACALLAQTHRGLGETNQERTVLTRLAALEADATEVYLRLMELAGAAGDWPEVMQNAERFLAVNPLLPQPYRHLARANEELGRLDAAIAAWRILLQLDPPDPAEAHYRLGRLLHQAGHPEAKRHLLQALEEAPRYREALRLLLQIHQEAAGTAPSASHTAAEPPAFAPTTP